MATDGGPDQSPAGRDYGATLWRPGPDTIENARISHFADWLRARRGPSMGGLRVDGYDRLWRWSVTEPADFWAAVWDYFDVLGRRGDGPVLAGGPMPSMPVGLWGDHTGERYLASYFADYPVRKILLGTPVAQAADPDALANPEVLAFFRPRESR